MDPNPIQPIQSPLTFTSTPSTSASPLPTKPDKGIPVLVLIPVLIVILASIFVLPSLLQKNKTIPISTPTTSGSQQPTPSSITTALTPSATPTPLQGSGKYSCSALGSCKNWDPQIQKENCTVTFADPNCLNQCGDSTKRCKF